MSCSVLITGGLGFLGRATATRFRLGGARVVGIGRGSSGDATTAGFNRWVSAEVSAASLVSLDENFDVIIHCAGNGSVPRSLEQPFLSFQDTVASCAAVLEHVRIRDRRARVLVASSAAVYGAAPDEPLQETRRPNPVSPYGFHKLMVEALVRSYVDAFSLRAAAVRFFSIYGRGLRRQLLWDAAVKIGEGRPVTSFWGSGRETRDWIHVDDAAELFAVLAGVDELPVVLNGGAGERVTVAETLALLREELRSGTEIQFNGHSKAGDPQHYLADTGVANRVGWRPQVGLREGFREYAEWVRSGS